MSAVLCCLGLVLALEGGAGGALAEARAAVERGDFARAAAAYQRAVEQAGPAPDLLYNLGTAHLKAGQVGPAALWLERAQRLAPADPDVAFNLARARERVGGPLAGVATTPRPGAALLRLATATWQRAALGVLLLGLALAVGRLLTPRRQDFWRRLLLGGSLLGLLAGAALAWLALARAELDARGDGVLVAPAARPAREAPARDAPTLFVVEPGMPLQWLEEEAEHARVRLPNGLEGWVEVSAVALLAPQDA